MKFKALTSYFLISCSWVSPLYGKKTDDRQPVLYYADGQTYDRELGILILRGHVEFNHQGSVLEADYVTYNENTDIVTASGNVRLRQPDGQINFADYIELTGDMKEGILLQLRTLLEDDSKIVALEGRKFEDRQELDQAVYTPCLLCGDKLPTWQINGRHVTKDDVNKDLTFTDAEFRFFDVPLLYFPYATQPLERRSGFLPYLPNYATDFGAVFRIPYYIVLSEDKDITLTPVFFTENNPMLLGEYRQAFGNGKLGIEGSIANYKKSKKDKKEEKAAKATRRAGGDTDFNLPETRGHIFGSYKQNINEIWRFKLDGGYVSDKTYFRKYNFAGWKTENALTSKAILEGFLNQRDYAAIKAYHFQGLRLGLDHQKRISAPLPIMEYSTYSGTDPLGGRFKFDGNLLNLYRREGINMQRGVGEVGWQRPWNTPMGQVFTVFASTRGDLYNVEHSHDVSNRKKREKLRTRKFEGRKKGGARFFPQTGFDWRWPFINSFDGQSVVIQPVAQIVAAPVRAVGVEARKIPNEDSMDPELNDANLFSPDRFPGYDRIDAGSRAVYGGEALTTGSLIGDVEVFAGQSYSLSGQTHERRHKRDRNRRDIKRLNLKRKSSDYVGRVELTPFSWLSFNYRFRLDQKSFHTRLGEAGGSIGPEIAKLSGTYLFVSRHLGVPNNMNVSQLNLTLSSQVTTEWSLSATVIKNFQKRTELERINKIDDHHGILSQRIMVNYRNDCFGMGFGVTQQNYRARDVRPGTLFTVNLWLKNIGDFAYSQSYDKLFGENGFFNNKGFVGEKQDLDKKPKVK